MTRLLAVLFLAILQSTAPRPQFEVASVKACGAADPGFRGGGPTEFSPDRVAINCQILKGLIQQAYIANKDGRRGNIGAVLQTPIEGGPDWISAERYSITAKSATPQAQPMMMGPMLQTLLEDRFKLQIRRLSREIPTWDLVVAKGGPKMTPFEEGSCAPSAAPSEIKRLEPGQRRCRNVTQFKGTSMVLDAEGITLDQLADIHLFLAAQRPVTNKTGMSGRFNFHMEYAPPEGMRLNGGQADPAAASTAPSIFTAMQEQLGLKLESAKGRGEYLVIDHVERPAEN